MRLRNFLAAGSAALLLASPAFAQTKTIKAVMHSDLKVLDPIWTTANIVRNHGYMVWDTLFAMDEKLVARPQMVDTFSLSPDKLTYTFTLRDGLKWHDGKPVTSEDCIASLKRWGARDTLGLKLLSFVAGFEPVDDRTFRIVLKEPYGLVIDSLAKPGGSTPLMMPKRIAETDPAKQISEFVGSGPFIFKADEWKPGEKTVYVKNPDYKPRAEPASGLAGGKVAKVDRVEWLAIPDHQTAVNALLAGEIDYVSAVPPELLPVLQADPDIQWAKAPILGKNFQVIINHTQPPFNDVRMRQALQYLVNQQDMMTAIFGNRKDLYEICGALFMCGGPYATDIGSERFLNPSVDKAKELIKAAGYDGTPIVYLHPMDGKIQRDGGTILVAAMRKAGLVVEDVQMDTATMFTRRTNKGTPKEGGWNVFMTGFAGDALMDPLTNPFMTGACEKAWIGWPCDAEMQKLWQDFLLAGNDAQRREIAIKLQAKANEIVTYIPIGQYNDISAWRKNVSGMVPGPILTLWNVQKTR